MLGREDNSFYYSRPTLAMSASARWLLSGYKLMQEVGRICLQIQVQLGELGALFPAARHVCGCLSPSDLLQRCLPL